MFQKRKANRDATVEELLRIEEFANRIPRELIPEVENCLNEFQWHPALGEKPDEWDKMGNEARMNVTRTIYECVQSRGSQKEFLRYHHIHNLGSTPAQFEDWWDSYVLREILEAIRER